ncbi:peptidase S24/S26A/S26B [Planococcus antarcticus DSM 14505]|uniref:Peptidase S24/S26A/S26B n=1 Tax=Planococcus antarcticus DSM 14505 TaxID=1185653 RepID=A0AA87LNT3_9BACL|nr:S24 family peptidase [Planococcus antarcticus]EIM05323.1 peptidase S24/S26A/S26B [Planococcus antarcticus DSM 14505]
MKKLFALEVTESNMQGILPGDEITVDGNATPRGNGQDIGVFLIDGQNYISRFTRFGNQIIMLQDNGRIQVVRSVNVDVIGKVVGGSIEMNIKKAPVTAGAHDAISLYA